MRTTPLTRDDIRVHTKRKYAYIELDMLDSVYLLTAEAVVKVYNLFRDYHFSAPMKLARQQIGYGPTVPSITVKIEEVSEIVDKLGDIVEDPANIIRSGTPECREEIEKANRYLTRAIRADPLNRVPCL